MTMKVGVIGFGHMGFAHVRVYKRLKECELVGICDTDVEKKPLADTCHTQFFTSYKELLKEELDAVSICTPTSTHREIALEALESDMHVLVEKPFVTSMESGKDIVKKATDTGKLLAVGYVERFNPAVNKLKEILDLSQIYSTLSLRFGPGTPRVKDMGVLLDLGSHEIDILNYLMKIRPEILYSHVSYNSNHNFEDYAYVSLKYNHVHSHIETSWLTQYKIRLLILYGNEKFYTLNYAQQNLKSHRPPPKVKIEKGNWQDTLWISRNIEEEIPIKLEEPLKLELQCFLKSIKKGEIMDLLCSGYDALEVLKIIEKAFTNFRSLKV